MKLTAGFHSVEDYPALVSSGADEVFCGFVPKNWQLRFGARTPLNRREVLCTEVQLGGESGLRILASMQQDLGVPVVLTLNSPCYAPPYYPWIGEYMQHCSDLGFRRFIVSDPGLLEYLSCQGLSSQFLLHISGEFGQVNLPLVKMLLSSGADRLIFHRHMSISEMALITRAFPALETEAFFLNEKCHYQGAYCRSAHCDEFAPLCRVPYRLSGGPSVSESESAPESMNVPGSSGCGFCALWKLRSAGVQVLKIVGRGASAEQICSDLSLAKQALTLLPACSSEEEYLRSMKNELFPSGCSGNCYYPR